MIQHGGRFGNTSFNLTSPETSIEALFADAPELEKKPVEQMHEITLYKHVSTLYRIARLHSLLDEKDMAYDRLKEAADAGFWHVRFMMQKNDDFKNMRNEERFKKMMRSAYLKSCIWMLERPDRAEVQMPDKVMAALDLEPVKAHGFLPEQCFVEFKTK